MTTTLYYPCRVDPRNGRITVPLTDTPCTREQAESFLRTYYWREWKRGDAIPQPISMIRGA